MIRRDTEFALAVVAAAAVVTILGLAVEGVRAVAQGPPVRPVEPDPWAVTAEDTASAVRTFTTGGASLEGKLSAVIQADRERLKPRVVTAAPTASRRVWLDRMEGGKVVGQSLVDLEAFTLIGPSEDGTAIEFAQSEFVVFRTPKTPAVEAHLREYFQPANLTGKAVAK